MLMKAEGRALSKLFYGPLLKEEKANSTLHYTPSTHRRTLTTRWQQKKKRRRRIWICSCFCPREPTEDIDIFQIPKKTSSSQ